MSAPRTIDLNADLGEEVTDDEGLLTLVTSANVACGYHAGTPEIMRRVCALAVAGGVSIGAQVSYADRERFGRVELEVEYDVLREQVADQVGTLREIAVAEGGEVGYVKPHGALYHRTRRDSLQAAAVLDGSASLPVLGMPGALLALAARLGRATWLEGFPDRAYDGPLDTQFDSRFDSGSLRPRDQPGALITSASEIVAQALELAPRVRSLCLHGDSPGAVVHAREVREALEAAGWTLEPLH